MKKVTWISDFIAASSLIVFGWIVIRIATNSEYVSGLIHDQFYSSMIWLYRVVPVGLLAIAINAIRAFRHGRAGRKGRARIFHLISWVVATFTFFGSSLIHNAETNSYESTVKGLSMQELLVNAKSKDERFMKEAESELSRNHKAELMKLVENHDDLSPFEMYRYLRLLNRPKDERLIPYWNALFEKILLQVQSHKEKEASEYLIDDIARQLGDYANDESVRVLEAFKIRSAQQGMQQRYSIDSAITKAKNPPYRILDQ